MGKVRDSSMMISWRRWKGQGQGQFDDDKLEEVEGARSREDLWMLSGIGRETWT